MMLVCHRKKIYLNSSSVNCLVLFAWFLLRFEYVNQYGVQRLTIVPFECELEVEREINHTEEFLLDPGSSEFCSSHHSQPENNTVRFCQNTFRYGRMVFIESGAQEFETAISCICDFNVGGEIKNISLSYSVANEDNNCGIKIRINGGAGEFGCLKGNLVVPSLASIEFSKSTKENIDLCLQVSLVSDHTNSTISVACKTDQRTTTKANVSTQTFPANASVIGGIVGGILTFLVITTITVAFICLRKRTNKQSMKSGKRTSNEQKVKRRKFTNDMNNTDSIKEVDDDTEVTYNVTYNIETKSDYAEGNNKCDNPIPEDKQQTNDDFVITDNCMYNIGLP